jgi:low affinity Fe/Cu permease
LKAFGSQPGATPDLSFTPRLSMARAKHHAPQKTQHRRTNNGSLAHKLYIVFGGFAQHISHATGHPIAFLLAVLVVVIWAVTGPLFGYSDTWQLVINTGTTIVTFLMVFLIQNTQNRDTLALHLKLSELLFAMKGAKNSYAALENLADDELEELHAEFCERADQARATLDSRRASQPAAAQRAKVAVKKSRHPAKRGRSSHRKRA